MFEISSDYSGTVGARGFFAVFAIWLLFTFYVFIPFFTFGFFYGLFKENFTRLKGYLKDYLYFLTGLYFLSMYYFGYFSLSKGYLIYSLSLTFIIISLPVKTFFVKNRKPAEKFFDYLSYCVSGLAFFVTFFIFAIRQFTFWVIAEILVILFLYILLFRKYLFHKQISP